MHGNETISFQNDKSEKNWNFSPAAKSANPKGLLFGLSNIMNFELSHLTFNFSQSQLHQPQPTATTNSHLGAAINLHGFRLTRHC